MRVIVAGFGNVLRGDDGFGVAVAQRLTQEPVPEEVEVHEVGIGGIHLVQVLLDGADALVIVDAVDLGREPGAVLVLEPEVRDLVAATVDECRTELADTHYATPDRAMLLAKALEVLPARTVLVGGQVTAADQLGTELSPPLRDAVDVAVAEVRRVVGELGIRWS